MSTVVFQNVQNHGGNYQNIDVDLIKEYAGVMNKCAKVNLSNCMTNVFFSRALDLYQNALENINNDDLNKSLVEFFSYLLNTVIVKFMRQNA